MWRLPINSLIQLLWLMLPMGQEDLFQTISYPSLDAANAPVLINAKTIGLSASRIYDGSENLIDSDVTLTTGVGGETLTHTGTTSSSKDVAVSNKYIDAITLRDAVDGSGGLAFELSVAQFGLG